MSSPRLRRDLDDGRPVALAFIWLTGIAALLFGAATERAAGGNAAACSIAAACGIATLGGLYALMLPAERRAPISRVPREPELGGHEATEGDRAEAVRPDAERTAATARLAADVAEDFNDILQAVIGSLDMVMDAVAADTPARRFAGMALTATTRGSRLTHHLLAYAGNQILRPESIVVADFLSDMNILLSRRLDPRITVDLLVTAAPRAFADPAELETALRNIAINAAQAMPGGGTLRIEAREEIGAGAAWVDIAVTDTGTGMDAATLAQAAEPFFSTRGGPGAGLGLSMAKGFAEQSGGTLRIASAPGSGTVVTLRLPAAASQRRPTANDAGGAGLHRRRALRQYG